MKYKTIVHNLTFHIQYNIKKNGIEQIAAHVTSDYFTDVGKTKTIYCEISHILMLNFPLILQSSSKFSR